VEHKQTLPLVRAVQVFALILVMDSTVLEIPALLDHCVHLPKAKQLIPLGVNVVPPIAMKKSTGFTVLQTVVQSVRQAHAYLQMVWKTMEKHACVVLLIAPVLLLFVWLH